MVLSSLLVVFAAIVNRHFAAKEHFVMLSSLVVVVTATQGHFVMHSSLLTVPSKKKFCHGRLCGALVSSNSCYCYEGTFVALFATCCCFFILLPWKTLWFSLLEVAV